MKDGFGRTGIFLFDHHVMARSVWCGREKMRPEFGSAGPCDDGPKEKRPELVTDKCDRQFL